MATIQASKSGVLVDLILDDQDAALLPGRVSIGSHGYGQIWTNGQVQLLHRWLLGLTVGDRRCVDHLNGDPLDNRRVNLRIVNASQSSSNVRGRAASGYRGVYPNKDRWAAAAKLNGAKIHLGTYDTPEEAYAVATAWRRANLSGWTDRR